MNDMDQETHSRGTMLSRRALGCAALFGVAGPLLVACGDDGATAPSGSSGGSSDDARPESGSALVAAADVPVGGGVVLPEHELVVTQPSEGEFKAFTSVCTHQGAQLSSVSQGRITCPLHGSQFAVEDGSNVTGPNGSEGGSVADLESFTVEVVDGQVVLA